MHPTDTALRDFSATCVKEFLTWSIKQTTRKVCGWVEGWGGGEVWRGDIVLDEDLPYW